MRATLLVNSMGMTGKGGCSKFVKIGLLVRQEQEVEEGDSDVVALEAVLVVAAMALVEASAVVGVLPVALVVVVVDTVEVEELEEEEEEEVVVVVMVVHPEDLMPAAPLRILSPTLPHLVESAARPFTFATSVSPNRTTVRVLILLAPVVHEQ